MQGIISKWNIGNAALASGTAGKVIIIILILISIIALAIFIKKFRELRRIAIQNNNFLTAFAKKSALDEFHKTNPFNEGPFFRIFDAAYSSIKSNTMLSKELKEVNLAATIDNAAVKEKHVLEGQLVFLATTVIISPFLGLLGTVWGILDSFMDIQSYGSAHINVVAPGIAEALVTTVAGLCVAIPAVIFYNYLTNKVNKLTDEFDTFTKNLLNEIKLSL